MPDPLLKVEKLVHGGKGLVRDRGQVILVPGVAPGELVRLEITARGRRLAEARAVEIMDPSPDRVDPVCPLFGRCGGCQLQHLAYPAQLRIKSEILAETLERIGRTSPPVAPIIPAASPFHYRSRLKLQVQAGRPGFFAEKKKEFIEVHDCKLARPEVNRGIPLLGPLLKSGNPQTIELMQTGQEEMMAVVRARNQQQVYCREATADRGAGPGWRLLQDRRIPFEQVNPEQNRALRRIVSELVKGLEPRTVIELYAGAGNLTEVMAPHCRELYAVDSDPDAVELGQERFPGRGQDKIKFVAADAAGFLDQAVQRGLRPDLIVLDPPRRGAREVLPGIVRLGPSHVIYVSCEPATLARDVRELGPAGFQPMSIAPIDMFPQTAAIESVALLVRSEG